MRLAVIGGGAAGFFCAIHAKENYPEAEVYILEKTSKLLSKVKISGGGRCNVTNACSSISLLSAAYPRGGKQLKKIFNRFYTKHTIEWFESRGVKLVTQEDDCIFPESQNSQTIIDCFLDACKKSGVVIKNGIGVTSITPDENGFQLGYSKETEFENRFDKVVIATGGSPKRRGLEWLEKLGHQIVDPVPSLFTFNMPDEAIRSLMGIVVPEVLVEIPGTKLKSSGPLLITHWGMSGPAILKLSAFGARILSEKNYSFPVKVNWVNTRNQDRIKTSLNEIIDEHPKKKLTSFRPYYLPERLWHFLLKRYEFPREKTWSELGKKGINKMITMLSSDEYQVQGKTTFKEEFVTCGGVSLEDVNMTTMESRVVPNLFFTGEVLDIDGITGGYNFQAAWTTAYIAASLGESNS